MNIVTGSFTDDSQETDHQQEYSFLIPPATFQSF